MMASSRIFAVRDHAKRMPQCAAVFRSAAMCEASMLCEVGEIASAIPELSPDTFDEGADINAITLHPMPSDNLCRGRDRSSLDSRYAVRRCSEKSDKFRFNTGEAACVRAESEATDGRSAFQVGRTRAMLWEEDAGARCSACPRLLLDTPQCGLR